MNHLATIFRCTILVFFLQYLLTTFDHRFIPLGELTVEPASPVLLGSSLTIYCSIQKFQHLNEWFDILLELNGETVNKWNRVNQTTMTFTVPSVRRPKSTALCKLKTDRWPQVVGELQIQAGLPPDRPKNIICLTTRSSEAVNCSWSKGQQTHITTYYNVTISRSNWTQVHSDVIQDSGEVSIGKGLLDVNTTYMLTITGYNQLGESAQSDPFPFCLQDIVIPETPKITRVEFERDSTAVMLLWKTAEFSEDLRPYIRLRTHNETWLDAEGVGIHQNLTEVENIRPLTEYEFQLKTCMITLFVKHIYTTSCTNRTNTSEMCVCSRWSSSEWKTSPGKGPSQQLDVWRTFSGTGTNGRKEVTVLWKPLPAEAYSGELQLYKISWTTEQNQEVSCSPAVLQCSLQLSAEVQALNISAVTSCGMSPPVKLSLRLSGVTAPALGDLTSAGNDDTILVSWSQLENKQQSELLYYVIEWISQPDARLQWKKLDKDLQNTSITGLTVGVRYKVYLYAVTTGGVSNPSSRLVYSNEKKPVSGPSVSVLVHVERRMQIQWDELPLEERRGFITHYTIYFHTLGSSSTEAKVSVPESGQRKMWLDCPGGTLVLQMTASNSAGEGPPGKRISSQPATSPDLVIVLVFIITVFIAIIANLMCCSCVRKRIKQSCMSWGPSWLVENMPKLGHSKAIQLLKLESEPLYTSIQYDPPLSPITVISQDESDQVYPMIQIDVSQTESGGPTAGEPSVGSDTWPPFDSQQNHCSYKPQNATLAHQEGLKNSSTNADGLIGQSNIVEDFIDFPAGLSCDFHREPVCAEGSKENVLGDRVIQERRLFEEEEESALNTVETRTTNTMETLDVSGIALNGGYFPQVTFPVSKH
ncbi:interleukin-12 receptor subunit beta-2-like isoform X2 [Gouania willdenowi]|uniref:Interleukin-12 receptor subunit beta-2-like n=1 Tax=Gouania willdenowi TaxID=441366 RepID=A0A8C5DQH3_GOUWI|nr:interleukin-12 receptor subunit beta-2-like isoform X2 [Gouania willdenowi]